MSNFDLVKTRNYDPLDAKKLRERASKERKEEVAIDQRKFAEVYDEASQISREARKYFDQDYDQNVNVIAGNGRTLFEAQTIWDQFRGAYHTYTAVKEIFQRAYALDPDSDDELGSLFNLVNRQPESAADFRRFESATTPEELQEAASQIKSKQDFFKKYGETKGTAEDEFTAVFGDQFFEDPFANGVNGSSLFARDNFQEKIKQGIEVSRKSFIDAPLEDDGLIEYFNSLINKRLSYLKNLIKSGIVRSGVKEQDVENYIDSIKTPKQLFLFIVGAFRNAMWKDPYARAWLVLKPNRKLSGDEEWDFNPVHKMFQAYIDPNSDYAKSEDKFRKLLAQNRSEGSNATNWFSRSVEELDGFWDKNVGPLFTALSDSLSGLVNLFRMSMMQLGYGLSQVGQMTKQANIMNKVLNDSIYYSLGRPGSLLRAVDNPFTREYGEPVVEIRQPFQRVHYLSSFSHILSNGIIENINGVATTVTAVSDGKYPVTVALDKSVPSERQVEKTVETGLYFDNVTGSGLFGALQPILHPFEFARGLSKFAQGTPDELLARRVGLAHLKESLKDIYSGEIVIIGNPDIRPHDIVYLADVYERMYGMFEVEQVVHHFTSELGFITSITPNALVTVNDPARWFMSSWVGSWLHMQSLRNDTRMYMGSLGSGINAMGQISVDGLAESLQTQMVGGIQYSHGASAIAKDVMAHFTSEATADIGNQVEALVANKSAFTSGQASIGGLGTMFAAATGIGAAVGGIAALAIPGAGALVSGGIMGLTGGIGGRAAWKGWSWIRDNVLDQHGCYIQYLNQNGKPMDAGLNQSGQGMVVGRYHTKKLLPGILGVRSNVKTAEGYSYIRTNDLLKNLGWKEKEVNDLVRYIDFENAIVNSQVLRYAGIGPEKAGLNRFFKVICRVVEIVDGDTVDVIDVLDSDAKPFRVRLDGINTPELNIIKATTSVAGKTAALSAVKVEDIPGETSNKVTFTTTSAHNFKAGEAAVINIESGSSVQLFNSSLKIEEVTQNTFSGFTQHPVLSESSISGAAAVYLKQTGELIKDNSPGGKAVAFVSRALIGKLFILRVSPRQNVITASFGESIFEPGSNLNNEDKYEIDVFNRILGVLFYKAPQEAIDSIKVKVNQIFANNKKTNRNSLLNTVLKGSFSEGVFFTRFNEIFEAASSYDGLDYFSLYSSQGISDLPTQRQKDYNAFFAMSILQFIYDKVSEWPNVDWTEYYEDGTPVSLNYELITKGLAKVYTKGLLVEQPSVIDSKQMAALPQQIQANRGI